jgi:hypothetical protein
MSAPFKHIPASGEFFFDLYGALCGSSGVVAESSDTKQLAGLCFYQVRSTHMAVGMMSVHPNYFQQGVGKALLKFITNEADMQHKPVRLVSSALNLDSFSLYNRAGFLPYDVYQDMIVRVPEEGIALAKGAMKHVRDACSTDVQAMVQCERGVTGMEREQDLHYLVSERQNRWHVSVLEGGRGGIDGFIASGRHPDIHMLGPGMARNQEQLLSLIMAELNIHRGYTVLQLVPVQCQETVHALYRLGAVNCELHFYQVRGTHTSFNGLYTPSYMFETG